MYYEMQPIVDEIKTYTEQGVQLKLELPFKTFYLSDVTKKYEVKDGVIVINIRKGEIVYVRNGFE